jgi:hypothetical protein
MFGMPPQVFGVGLKSVVYKTCVLPILLFGSEPWALPNGLVKRLNTFHEDCLRQMLGVRRSDRQSSAHIHDRCAEHPIVSYMSVNRLRQLGHTMRMTHTRLPKLALWSAAPGPRAVGRARMSRFDVARRDCAAIGIDVPVRLDDRCSNRPAWKRLAYLSCQGAVRPLTNSRLGRTRFLLWPLRLL